MFSQVLPVRFFWMASWRKGCRDSSIRTTSWEDSMLMSRTVRHMERTDRAKEVRG
jgi:hypothetical protein